MFTVHMSVCTYISMYVHIRVHTYKHEVKVIQTCVKLIQTHVLDQETSVFHFVLCCWSDMQSLNQKVSDCGIVCTWTHFFYQLYELFGLVHLDICVCCTTFRKVPFLVFPSLR